MKTEKDLSPEDLDMAKKIAENLNRSSKNIHSLICSIVITGHACRMINEESLLYKAKFKFLEFQHELEEHLEDIKEALQHIEEHIDEEKEKEKK